eukprot:1652397-Pyramimonas_sp.AAC.1
MAALEKCPHESDRIAIVEAVKVCTSQNQARTLKAKGDTAFDAEDYDTAILMYTDALDENEAGYGKIK